MDVFDLRNRLIGRYSDYVRSFPSSREPSPRAFVEQYLDGGNMWPEPLVQLNPSLQPGARIDQLVAEGTPHPECRRIFRGGKMPSSHGIGMRLYRHPEEAVRAGGSAGSYVVTTGTGSGKPLTYVIPIVDHVLRHGSGKGIKAHVVYPMNVLTNSQHGEREKFLTFGYPDGKGPVTFERYTGQEQGTQREWIRKNPPDILLTTFLEPLGPAGRGRAAGDAVAHRPHRRQRAAELLASHRRVRQAASLRGIHYAVEAKPPDLPGLSVLMPTPDAAHG